MNRRKNKRFGDGGSTDEEMGPPKPEEEMGPPTPGLRAGPRPEKPSQVLPAPRPEKPKAKKPKLYEPYNVTEGKVLPAPPPKKPKPLPPTMRVAKGGMIKSRGNGIAMRGKTKGRMR
jgi:hypothetical protein